ncbi:bacteriophage integrase [Secundilactobacillus kimchicus JCM 15530]|uniref:Bacteriophage integrase n=1 Tax=Secundilactobacillus kimchicus JCM 15530 TaxID=1302272 RepID=A0A0R1HUC1_9LACO|nr:site-specific integrase [Secundilactobacillus kimchicus]KRK48131.1 bacteriophage integrase [Secundilactobacillus kimchicus JCM 15530]
MASITSYTTGNGDKRYMIQVYQGLDPQTGKPKRMKRRGFKTKKEATLEANRLELAVSNGDLQQENNISFKKVYEQWYQGYINTVRVSTYARTAGMFNNHILPAFGNKRIRTITVAQVQTAVNKWFKFAPNNYKKWYHYTANVFDYAIKQGYMSGVNPTKRITLPKPKKKWNKQPENFWTKEQLTEFFSFIDSEKELEKYSLFRVLAFAGIRRGECLALTWNDISFSKSTMRINKTLTQGVRGETIVQPPKTIAGNREIALDATTLTYLKRWRALQKKHYLMLGYNTLKNGQLVFATSKNTFKSLNTPAKWLNSIIKKHGLKKMTVHGFRHTSASLLFMAGATIKEVQTRLGHDDAETTLNVYTHVTKQMDNQTAEKLASYLNF